ncbi:MAG: hypothetical protein BRD35_06665 [Bacteroidetes bacterium QH_7_62_13]|nr:MAG: hypothetical protein BRD35_06665 [Bacteroidetes bacterium QH_7_62_13]
MRDLLRTVGRLALPVLAAGLLFGAGSTAAQTGPGGVGNKDGSTASGVSQPQNALWLRADEGVTTNGSGGVTDWADQSGNGNDGAPELSSPQLDPSFGGFGGASALQFRSAERDVIEVTENTDLDNTNDITVFSAVYFDTVDGNARGIISKRDDPDSNYSYGLFSWDTNSLNFDVDGFQSQNRVDPDNVISPSNNFVIGGRYSNSEGEAQLYVDGTEEGTSSFTTTIPDNPSNFRVGILTTGGDVDTDDSFGRFFEGRVGDVIVYRSALNKAQRTIVSTYLADKYGTSTSGEEIFSYDNGGFSNDVAGIGRAANSDEHQFAKSSLLGVGAAGAANAGAFDASGFGADDQYIFLGHNGLRTTAFVEPINGRTANAKRLGRTWRADFKGSNFGGGDTKSVTIEVDASILPSQPDPQNDSYFVVVDGASSSFDSGSLEAYELTGSGTLTATVDLEDGDYVTIGAGQRTVNFTETTSSGFENTATPSVTATLNLPYTSSTKSEVSETGTAVDVTIGEEGDLDGSGLLEDGGTTNDAGTNANGDFEADDGDGSDSGGTEGSFDGDYRLSTSFSNPLSIGPGAEEATAALEIDDDGLQEQTEKFEVTVDGVTNAVEGREGRLVYSINDDDEVRDLTLVDGDDGNSSDEDNTSSPETFTVTLDQDGNGTSPATSAPYTSVEFVVDEKNTDATPGTDLSNPTVDFKIVDESGSGGDEFQERLSPTRGRLNFEDGSNSGSETAELKLDINQDAVDDVETEDIVLTLENPQSAKLSQDTDANLDLEFTINDDDTAPNVQFAQSSSDGAESADGSVAVELSSTSGGPDVSGDTVTVAFSVDAANSSATEGASNDFTLSPSSGMLTFVPGTTTQSITLDVEDDNLDEVDETVEIDLDGSGDETTAPTLGATLGGTTSHTYTIRDNDAPAIGSTGPGGVGDAESDGRLKLWLRADAIADSTATDGDPLSTWPDTSGNDNDASAGGTGTPTFRASVTDNAGRGNGRPAIEFDGSDDRMTGTLTIAGDASYFAVANGNVGGANNGRGAVAEFASDPNPGTSDTRNGLLLPGDELRYLYDGSVLNGASTDGDDTNESGFVIFGAEDAEGTANIRLNGGSPSSVSVPVNSTISDYAIGALLGGGEEISGDVGEVIAFSGRLSDVQRILVENYLSAKYDISTTTDVYAGDNGGNGDYDRGVFGVGQASDGSLHSTAETDGLRFSLSQGAENGDYLLAGHRTAANSATTSDIGGVGGSLEARSDRAWYMDRSNDASAAITVDVTIDLSEAGLTGPAGAASNYVLVDRAAATNNDWAAVQNGADAVNGDEITFNGVPLSDGTEITLGTTDAENSPLVANRLTITGNSGGADGKDQGWRYLGLPVTGATAGDLQRGNGATFIDFDVNMAYTNPGGNVQNGGSGWVPVTDPSTALTNGRGVILWLYDDQVYPLDPSITLKTAPGLTPPGESDVTVGDGTPSGTDPALSNSDKEYLLSNPYAVPFELGSLFNGAAGGVAGDGFDSAVQVWEADATKNGNDVSGTDDANVGSFVVRSRSSSDRISPWQGFLLTRTSVGSGEEQITFNSSGRLPETSVDLIGSKTQEDGPTQHRVPLRLAARDNEDEIIALDRAALVLFHESATDGRDYLDAPKFEPMTDAYATLAPVAASSDETLRAQESRPLPSGESERVPLSFQTKGVSGTFEIAIPDEGGASSETPSIPEGWELELIDTNGTEDPSDDTAHPLTPGGSAYTFDGADREAAAKTNSADDGSPPSPRLRRLTPQASPAPDNKKAAATDAEDGSRPRFVLKVRPAEALPVELANLEARRANDRAVVRWQTASETNNAGFEVQYQRRSAKDTAAALSASDWTTLGFVDGAGTTTQGESYRFETDALDYGRHAFRLKQVDADGTETPTEPVEVRVRLDDAFAVETPYPNPATERATLPVTVRERQDVTVEVYDLLGRRVRVVQDRKIEEQQTTRISIPLRSLSSGSYFVRVRGETFTATRRLSVVR